MKRKNNNIEPTKISEEDSSSNDAQTDEDVEFGEGEEDSVVDNEEADAESLNASEDVEFGEEEEDSVVDNEEADAESLDGSATESDEDESDGVSEDDKPNKSKNEKLKGEILQKYEERQGKQLYLRFPHKVPETQESLEKEVGELTSLFVKVHKPRQNCAKFCLVDFATKEDRDTVLKKLKLSIKNGELKKYVVNIPRTESSDFVKELAERKIRSIENRKAKILLKRASRKALKQNKFTSSVIVLNLPKTASVLQIRELFADAVDINVKPCKGKLNKDKSIAAITFPTTMDAKNAVKKKLSVGGNELVIKFDNKISKRNISKDSNDPKILSPNNELSSKDESEPKIKKQKLEKNLPISKEKKSKNSSVSNLNKSKKLKKVLSPNDELSTKDESEPKIKKQKVEKTLPISKEKISKNSSLSNLNKSKKVKKNSIKSK